MPDDRPSMLRQSLQQERARAQLVSPDDFAAEGLAMLYAELTRLNCEWDVTLIDEIGALQIYVSCVGKRKHGGTEQADPARLFSAFCRGSREWPTKTYIRRLFISVHCGCGDHLREHWSMIRESS